jgi:hypothetical protein
VGSVVNVRCLPAHDEADAIVGLMVAQVLGRRGYTVAVANADSMASELAASLDVEKVDVVVVSALPPKAALHARYLLKLITSRGIDLNVIVGLWTNNNPGAVEANNVQTATSLDTLHGHFDQITPVILLRKSADPVPDRDPIPSGT